MTESPAVKRTRKRVVLIAHDNLKPRMVDWATQHRELLASHELMGTGTTGGLIEQALGLPVYRFKSGPLGGDQQIGAKVCEGEIDLVIFFWDPMAPHPHDVDVKALLRIAALYDVPIACNRSTADLMVQAALGAPCA